MKALALRGSDNVITAALGGVQSLASKAMSARNKVYAERSVVAFTGVRQISVGWDGSTHGGCDVNVGYALNVVTSVACCMKPKVAPG